MTDRKPRLISMTIREALYELVHDSDISPKAMAELIDKALPTLLNAANGGEGAPRFDAVWLAIITQSSRNYVALDVIERMCGRVAVKVDAKRPEGSTLQAEALHVTKELGDACEAIRKALDPKGHDGAAISADEKTRIRKETYELLKEAARLWTLSEGL